MGVTCGTGTVYPSGTAEFALGFPHVLVGFVLVKYMLLLIWFHVVMYGTLKMIFSSSLLPFALSEVHVLLMLFVFIYVCWCPTRFIWHVSMSGRQGVQHDLYGMYQCPVDRVSNTIYMACINVR